jgi:hypothetical protein
MATKMTELERHTQLEDDNIELGVLQNLAQSVQTNQDAISTENLEMTRKNIAKTVAAGFSFFFAGTNDGSLGALTPYILRTYDVGTQYVALMYDPAAHHYSLLTMAHASP